MEAMVPGVAVMSTVGWRCPSLTAILPGVAEMDTMQWRCPPLGSQDAPHSHNVYHRRLGEGLLRVLIRRPLRDVSS